MLGEKERKKWKFSDVGAWLRNAFMATLRGEFLLRFQASKYFIHIIYTFLLFWVSIYLSLNDLAIVCSCSKCCCCSIDINCSILRKSYECTGNI